MIWAWFVLLAVIIITGYTAYTASNGSGIPAAAARRKLDERLAAGELTTEEHAARAAALQEHSSVRLAWPALVLGLVLLALLGTLMWWSAGGMMRSGRRGDGGGMMDSRGMMDSDVMMGSRGMMDDDEMGDDMRRAAIAATAGVPVPGADEVQVSATEMRFDPKVILSTVGEAVNLTLINEGAVSHNLSIQGLGFAISAEPGERVTGSLTVEDVATYEFVCTVPDHAEAGMRGTLRVSAAR